MEKVKSLAPTYKVIFGTGIVVLLSVAWITFVGVTTPGILRGFADKDFANYWMAGRLILDGRVMDLFGPHPIYFAHLSAYFGPLFPWHNWSYPPHFLLLLWPLGYFGYKAGMLVFLAASGALFIWALRAFAGRGNLLAWVAALPFMAHNIWVAQNGFLSAGFGLGALALRERQPVLAGVLLGFLTIKPQLGFLFPFLLLAERRWTVIASATITTLCLVCLSAAVFGVDTWRGYINEVLPYQTFVMRELEGTFLAMLPSIYGMLRNWTLEPDLALSLHMIVAIPAALTAIYAFFRLERMEDRSVILLLATFLITPYALTYDLGLYAAGVALLANAAGRDWPADRFKILLFSVAMLLPVAMMPLGQMKISIPPAVMLCIFVVAVRHYGVFAARAKRSLAPAFSQAASPAAASD